MTTLEVLKAAREHLSDPARWIKDQYIDHDWGGSRSLTPCDARGAIYVQGGVLEDARALRAALPEGFYGLESFNDDPRTTHADILALFDRAIAAEEAPQ